MRHVLVRSLWKVIDSRNCVEAIDTFDILMKSEFRRLLIDFSDLHTFTEFWPICLGPMSPLYRDIPVRWALAGLRPKVRVALDLLGNLDWVNAVDACPGCGAALDLPAGSCSACGSFDVIIRGPGVLERKMRP